MFLRSAAESSASALSQTSTAATLLSLHGSAPPSVDGPNGYRPLVGNATDQEPTDKGSRNLSASTSGFSDGTIIDDDDSGGGGSGAGHVCGGKAVEALGGAHTGGGDGDDDDEMQEWRKGGQVVEKGFLWTKALTKDDVQIRSQSRILAIHLAVSG
jgi:hypothetical protein